MIKKKKKNKYNCVRTTLQGISFHSKLEASFYIPIKRFCENNKFRLELQVKYPIYVLFGKKCHYISDFTIYGMGIEAVVDAKGVLIDTSMKKISIVKNLYSLPFYVGSCIKSCLLKLNKIFGV